MIEKMLLSNTFTIDSLVGPEYGLPSFANLNEGIAYFKDSHTFIVPDNLFEVSIYAIGGGGSGHNGNIGDGGGGGGIGGSSACISRLKVTPGEVLNILVGQGGRGEVPKTTSVTSKIRANSGASSTIKIGSLNLLTAAGGLGGTSYVSVVDSPIASSFVLTGRAYLKTARYTGGLGGKGYDGGGGGGGAASFKGNGGNGSSAILNTNSGYNGSTAPGLYAGGGGGGATAQTNGSSGAGHGGKGQNNTTGGGGGGAATLIPGYLARNAMDGNGLTTTGSKGGDGGWPGGGGGGSYDNNTGLTSMGANGMVYICWGANVGLFD